MPHDKPRNALDYANRVVDDRSSTRAYERQLHPKMTPTPRDYASIVRAAGCVYGTKDGALITGPPTDIIEAAWLTCLQQSVAHGDQDRITAIPATHVAAHAHSTGRNDSTLSNALLPCLTPDERNYVRRHRLAAVQSDPAHLQHHVSGPTATATKSLLRWHVNQHRCVLCAHNVPTGIDGYQRHVLLDCPDGDSIRDLHDRRIAELLARDGRVSWLDPTRRDQAAERSRSDRDGLAAMPGTEEITHDIPLPSEYEWTDGGQTVRHQPTGDDVPLHVLRHCNRLIRAADEVDTGITRSQPKGLAGLLADTREIIAATIDHENGDDPTLRLHPATARWFTDFFRVTRDHNQTILSTDSLTLPRPAPNLSPMQNGSNNSVHSAIQALTQHANNKYKDEQRDLYTMDGSAQQVWLFMDIAAEQMKGGHETVLVVIHNDTNAGRTDTQAKAKGGARVCFFPAETASVGTGTTWEHWATPYTPHADADPNSHAERERQRAADRDHRRSRWTLRPTSGISPPTELDPHGMTRSSRQLCPHAMTVYLFATNQPLGPNKAALDELRWTLAMSNPNPPHTQLNHAPEWWYATNAPAGIDLALRRTPDDSALDVMRGRDVVDWHGPKLDGAAMQALHARTGIDVDTIQAWNQVRLHNDIPRHRLPTGSVPQGVADALRGDAHRAQPGNNADMHATVLAVARLHVGKQNELERQHLQHTRARLLADGYNTTGDVHSWTTVTPCPQCNADVTTTRLMQHGEHHSQQACHVCAPPDHNADTMVPDLGQIRWDPGTKTMYTDVEGDTELLYWSKRDHTWHNVERATQTHQWYTGLPAASRDQAHRNTGMPSLASRLGWPASPGPGPTTTSPTPSPRRSTTRSPRTLTRSNRNTAMPRQTPPSSPLTPSSTPGPAQSPRTPSMPASGSSAKTKSQHDVQYDADHTLIGEHRWLADGTRCTVTFVEYNSSRGKGRMCNTTPVWVCTKPTIGAHDPRCTVCTRLTRKEFNDLQPTQWKRLTRRRSNTLDNQQSTKDPTPDTPDDTAPLIEYHMCSDEDDIQDDTDDDAHERQHHKDDDDSPNS